jgi:predicted phage terminase large subunit-like protein
LNITIPAVATSKNDVLGRKIGEALMPERGFEWSLKGLMLKKAEVGTRAWNAQFQQNPMAEGGNIIKKEWLKTYYKRDLPVYFDDIVLSCDLSNNSTSNSDYSAFQVWGKCGTEHYMLDRGKARRTFNGQIEIIRQFVDKWIAKGHAVRRVLVEKRATGTAAIDVLGAELKNVAVVGFEVGYTDKSTRVNTVSNFFEGGHVWLPDESIDSGIEDYKNTLMLFPNVAHDDEVDATSQYLIYCIKQVSGRIVSESNGFLEKLAKAIRS